MEIDADGLQKSLYLSGREALGTHRGLSHSSRTEGGDGLQILHQQCSRHNRGKIIIIGNLRTTGGNQLIRRSLGDIEKCIYLVFLDGMTSLCHTCITGYHLRTLEAIETTDNAARGRCIVEVDHTYRHILRQSLVHQ